jgi:hypothetical protein
LSVNNKNANKYDAGTIFGQIDFKFKFLLLMDCNCKKFIRFQLQLKIKFFYEKENVKLKNIILSNKFE